MSIELMLKNCKTEFELRSFAEAQQKTLTQLMKKNQEQKEEIDHLKKLVVNGALPIIGKEGNSPLAIESDEIEIAKRELRKLNEKSMDSEPLMLEESKKLEIYTKILTSRYKEKESDHQREVKELNADQLLAIAESPIKNV